MEPSHGAFLPSGSWGPEAVPGPFHQFCVDLLRLRRQGQFPWQLALTIAQSPYKGAFPNAMDPDPAHKTRWTAEIEGKAIPWAHVHASTSAEEMLRRSGAGAKKV